MSTFDFLLYLSIPFLIGSIIAVINHQKFNQRIDKMGDWFSLTKRKNAQRTHWFSRYFKRPMLWTFTTHFKWTANIRHDGLKSGIRLSIMLYLLACWITILLGLIFFAIQLVLIAIVLYLIYLFLVYQGVFGSDEKAHYVENFEMTDPNERIDSKTGKIQIKDSFGWTNTHVSINQETGEIHNEGLFGKKESTRRINPKTGIIEEKGLFGWQETDFRINKNSGKKQKKSILGWEDI